MCAFIYFHFFYIQLLFNSGFWSLFLKICVCVCVCPSFLVLESMLNYGFWSLFLRSIISENRSVIASKKHVESLIVNHDYFFSLTNIGWVVWLIINFLLNVRGFLFINYISLSLWYKFNIVLYFWASRWKVLLSWENKECIKVVFACEG